MSLAASVATGGRIREQIEVRGNVITEGLRGKGTKIQMEARGVHRTRFDG